MRDSLKQEEDNDRARQDGHDEGFAKGQSDGYQKGLIDGRAEVGLRRVAVGSHERKVFIRQYVLKNEHLSNTEGYDIFSSVAECVEWGVRAWDELQKAGC